MALSDIPPVGIPDPRLAKQIADLQRPKDRIQRRLRLFREMGHSQTDSRRNKDQFSLYIAEQRP
jgi:hypothetical protein